MPTDLELTLQERRRNGRRDYNLVEPNPVSDEMRASFYAAVSFDPEYWRGFVEAAKDHLGLRAYLWLKASPSRAQGIQMSLDDKTRAQILDRTGAALATTDHHRWIARWLGIMPPL